MKGEGFTVKVKVGDRVHAGDELITLRPRRRRHQREEPAHPDGDRQLGPALGLRARARASSPRAATWSRWPPSAAPVDGARRRRQADRPNGDVATRSSCPTRSACTPVRRPCCRTSPQQYESDITLKRGDDQANAKSVMAIMGMEVSYGDKVQVVAFGPDAAAGGRRAHRADHGRASARKASSPIAEDGGEPARDPRSGRGRPGTAPTLGGPESCCSASPPRPGSASARSCRSGTRTSRSPRTPTTGTGNVAGSTTPSTGPWSSSRRWRTG